MTIDNMAEMPEVYRLKQKWHFTQTLDFQSWTRDAEKSSLNFDHCCKFGTALEVETV